MARKVKWSEVRVGVVIIQWLIIILIIDDYETKILFYFSFSRRSHTHTRDDQLDKFDLPINR